MGSIPNKTWLVLSAGGARGLAHLGVLDWCRKEGLEVEGVVGTSMGAIAGAVWCSGADLDQACSRLQALRVHQFIRPRITRAWVSLDPLRRAIEEVLPVRTFEELQVPLTVICTDMRTGKPVRVEEGPLVEALLASGTFGGLCDPAELEGRRLIDGGYSAPLPVDLCPEGKRIIAVDTNVIPTEDHSSIPLKRGGIHPLRLNGFFQHFFWSLDSLFHVAARAFSGPGPDHLIEPRLEGMSFLDFGRGAWAMDRGREAANLAADEIRSSPDPVH